MDHGNGIAHTIKLMYYVYFGITMSKAPSMAKDKDLLKICVDAETRCKNRGWELTKENVIKVLQEDLLND